MRKILSLFGALLLYIAASAQSIDISGKITDNNGQPVAGASIQERASKRGTISDVNGDFKLSVSKGSTVIISSIGFDTKEFKADNPSGNYSFSLTQSNQSLSEVVVTGVGVATSKKKLAFDVTAVNVNNQVKVPTGDVGQQLVGQIAGAQISSTNGSPGAPLNILLRGINTVRGGTSPMILMDGIEVRATDLNSIDVSIIERVEVVQGAAAATIYGAQGANGVIQIFTKKAKAGKISIDVSSSYSTNELLNIGNVRKADKHAFVTNANNEVIKSNGQPIQFDPVLSIFDANVQYNALSPTSYAEKAYDRNLKYYDHYKMFFQKGQVYNNSVTISGNKDKLDFLLGASNNQQTSNFKRNGEFKRSNLTSNMGIELFKNFRLRSVTQLVYTNSTLNDPTGRSIVYSLNNTRPFANYDYKDPDGNYGIYFGDAAGVNAQNPNYINQYSSTADNKVDVIQNFNANYKVNRFLELDAKYGLNHQTQNIVYRYENQEFNKNAEDQQYWIGNYNPVLTGNTTGEIDNITNRTTFQNFIGTATIRTDLQKDFNLRIPITTSTQLAFDYRKDNYKQFYAYGYDAPSYSPWNASQAGVYKVVSDFSRPFVTYGYLVNQRFEYSDLAGASVGFRTDYSSAFGRGAKAQTFPRGDAFLNVAKFGFYQNSQVSRFLSDVKIRAAYGEAGIQPGAFDRFPVLGSANLGANSVFTFPVNNPNPDLTVELSKELEYGIDLGFRLLQNNWLRNGSFTLTRWDRETSGAIYNVDAAPSSGVGTIRDNAFGLASNGWQATLNLGVLSNKNLNWDFAVNYGKQTSKISSVRGPEVVVTSAAGSSNYVLKAGEKIGQLYGFILLQSVDQIDPKTGQSFIPKANQGNYEVASNGWVVDKATKRPVSSATQYSFGDPNPKFNMSFINNVTFKKFVNFNMQWDWVHGAHLYNQTKSWMYRDGIHSDYQQPITINGETHAYTAFYRGVYQAGANNGTKNYFYEDASFMRLRNLSVGINLAQAFNLKFANKIQLVFSGRNLVTFTNYTGYDPEVSSGTSNSSFDRGVDHNTIPNTKSYQIGINLGF